MRIIIIEDEPLIAAALKEEILRADASIQVVGILTSIAATLQHLETNGFPDLFFSDIELGDGLSFEIFKRTHSTIPVIFCTAYNHYALEAFRVYGIDYILKPFVQEDISSAIAKYKSMFQATQPQAIDFDAVLQLIGNQKRQRKSTILLYQGDKIIPLAGEKIAIAELKNGVVYVYTFAKERIAVNYNMEKLHGIVGKNFYRVNRQFLINRQAIEHVAQYFARKLLIKTNISFSEQLIVSKANASDFLRWLEAH